MSFEDTKDGVVAARKAGVVCVGVAGPGSAQDLSEADLTISGTLDRIIDAIPIIVRGVPSEAVRGIQDYLVHMTPE
jgi:beta-phosphoglucomutase-like phosphatase (HAD superfamily)